MLESPHADMSGLSPQLHADHSGGGVALSNSLPVLPIEPPIASDEEGDEDELPELPATSRWGASSSGVGSGVGGGGGGGTQEVGGAPTVTAALAASRRGSLYIFRQSDEVIVTPFAQVLHTLRAVYDSVRTMTSAVDSVGLPNHSHSPRPGAASTGGSDTGNDDKGPLAKKTLNDLEWCLEQLETVQTHRSVADMASSKFKKLLKIELERMSNWPSAAGGTSSQIENYITSTFLENDDDARASAAVGAAGPPSAASEASGSGSGGDGGESGGVGNVTGVSPQEAAAAASAPPVPSAKEANGAQATMTKVPVMLKRSPTLTEGPLPPKLGVETPHADQLSAFFSDSLDAWGIDIFRVDELSCHHPLVTVVYAISEKRDFFNKFHIHPSTLVNYFSQVEQHYKPENPYHNAIHAADVTQSTHVLLNAPSLGSVFSDLEILASVFACAIHDVNHPGVTNQFLINTENELAIMYNDASVLENHHCAVAFKLLQDPSSNILKHLEDAQRKQLRKMVIDMVLATDMSKHMSLLADLKTMVETKKVAGGCLLKLENYSEKMQIMQNMVHCADLSNPAKPLCLSAQWVTRVMEEFFNQGDREKALGLPVSPMCCRETANVEKSQVSFIDFIVHPLWEAWTELVHPDAEHILTTLANNRDHYSELSVAKETAAAAAAAGTATVAAATGHEAS